MSYTVVTCLFDIGRGSRNAYRRDTNAYARYFMNVLSLKANMIVFCEKKFIPIVKSVRNKLNQYDTQIVETKIEDLVMYQYKDLLFDV